MDASISTGATDHSAIDKVVYLASLASNPKDIDPILEELRMVTATVSPGQQLSSEGQARLLAVQRQVEDYLVQRDPVRAFTKDSLQARLARRFENVRAAHQAHPLRTVWTIIGLGVVMYMLPFALPFKSMQLKGILGATLMLNAIHIGIAYLFLSSVHEFKPELRRAFLCISIGMVIVSLTQIQLPIMTVYNLAEQPLFRYGGFMLPYIASTGVIYLGLRYYAHVLKIRNLLTSLPAVLGLALVLASAVMAVPHASHPAQEGYFDMSVMTLSIVALFSFLGAAVAFRLTKAVTELYARALWWVFWALLVVALGAVEYGLAIFTRGELMGTASALASTPFILSGLLMLRAGYVFKKASAY